MKTLLAVGCGNDPLQQWADAGYAITRLDIDPALKPDIVASMVDMGQIGEFDVLYCSHALEHLYPHEVPKALAEFYRVLRDGGQAIVLVPDLEGVPATDEILPGGTTTGLHLYYGDSAMIESRPYMAHHSGFVSATLKAAMKAAGFEVQTKRMSFYNLLGIGIKGKQWTLN